MALSMAVVGSLPNCEFKKKLHYVVRLNGFFQPCKISQAFIIFVGLYKLLSDPQWSPFSCDKVPQSWKQAQTRHLCGQPYVAHRCTHSCLRQCLCPSKLNTQFVNYSLELFYVKLKLSWTSHLRWIAWVQNKFKAENHFLLWAKCVSKK